MRSTAFALKDEYDEVLVSSTEVLEASIAAVRDGLNDFKTDVHADLTGVKGEIKSVRADLTGELTSVGADLTNEIKSVREDLTSELKSLREKSDRAFERLFTKFDAEIKETNKALDELEQDGAQNR